MEEGVRMSDTLPDRRMQQMSGEELEQFLARHRRLRTAAMAEHRKYLNWRRHGKNVHTDTDARMELEYIQDRELLDLLEALQSHAAAIAAILRQEAGEERGK